MMVDYQLKKIVCKDIDTDNHLFRITNDMNIEVICDSIKEFGLINPPILKKEKNMYIIVSGFKRVASCKKIGHDSINSLIIETDDIYSCHRISILDNSNNRKLGFLEVVNCINSVKKFHGDSNSLSSELSRLLNISNGDKLISKMLKIILLPDTILKLIDTGHISISIAEELVRYDEKVILLFGSIFEKLNTPSNFQKDIFNLILEIKLKEKKSIECVLKDVVNFIKENTDNKDAGRVYKFVKNYLYARRYPEITLFNNQIEKRLAKLVLDKRCKMNNHSNGDAKLFQLQLNFDGLFEFDDLIENIKKLRMDTKFNDLFKPI